MMQHVTFVILSICMFLLPCIFSCSEEGDDNGGSSYYCEPSCGGKECGSDGCGGTCGSCGSSATCSGGQCVSGERELCGIHEGCAGCLDKDYVGSLFPSFSERQECWTLGAVAGGDCFKDYYSGVRNGYLELSKCYNYCGFSAAASEASCLGNCSYNYGLCMKSWYPTWLDCNDEGKDMCDNTIDSQCNDDDDICIGGCDPVIYTYELECYHYYIYEGIL